MTDEYSPRVLVITGMHRSGTSLAASLFQRAGVHIGDRLLAGERGNPHGLFEDLDFLEFQDRLLKDRGRTILVDDSFVFDPTDSEIVRAGELVSCRRERPLWGWKDPRTSLFLDFWDERLSGARYVFVFRHPLDVLLSLVRRATDHETLGLTEPLWAWETYNANILGFYRRHGDRCALVHADGLGHPELLNGVFRHKLHLPIAITPDAWEQSYRPNELHAASSGARQAFGVLEPEVVRLYETLVNVADLKPLPPATESGTDDLAGFRTALERFLPHAGAGRRGLLLTLLEHVAPDELEVALKRQHETFFELHEGNRWLEQQRSSWERTAKEREDKRLRARLGRLVRRLSRQPQD